MRRIRNDGKPIDISDRIDSIANACCAAPGPIAVYLHGSYGTEQQTPLSDVDFAVVYRHDEPLSLDAELNLIGRVTEIAHEDDISVTNLNRAGIILRHRVLRHGRLLKCVDDRALSDFIECTIDEHADFIVDHEAFLREFDASLLEAYGHGR